MKIGIAGYYRVQIFTRDHNCRFDSGWCHNLITDQGLDALAQQSDVMTHYTVGTSSNVPLVTDTWVYQFVATTSTTVSNIKGVAGTGTGGDPYYGYRRQTKRFDFGTATGNLSELVVGWSATTGTAFMRELIRDGVGNPTTITVLSDEYLEVTYELRYYVPNGDFTGVCTIDSDAYNYTMRAASCTSTVWWADSIGLLFTYNAAFTSYHEAYTGSIGGITTVPSGNSGTGTQSISVNTYNPGDLYRDFTMTASSSQWNVSGGVIRSLVMGCTGNRWQCEYSKVSDGTGIVKNSGITLTVGYRISWDRAA